MRCKDVFLMFSEMFIFEECLSDKIFLNMHLNININIIKYSNFFKNINNFWHWHNSNGKRVG